MYVRVTRMQGNPAETDKGIAYFREKVVPATSQAPGYLGVVLLVNRETGESAAGTYWETAGAMGQAEALAQKVRSDTPQDLGARIFDVDRFEIAIIHRAKPPVSPAYLRLNELTVAPDKVDSILSETEQIAVPKASSQAGYIGFLGGVNRVTGRIFVTSTWESEQARAASEAAMSAPRQAIGRDAGANIKVSQFEVAFSELKAGALASA